MNWKILWYALISTSVSAILAGATLIHFSNSLLTSWGYALVYASVPAYVAAVLLPILKAIQTLLGRGGFCVRFLRRIKLLLYRLLVDPSVRELGRPYRVSLDLLIVRAEERMVITPKCPFCGKTMLLRRSTIVKAVPIRDDQGYKCRRCKHTAHFGIPITRELYDEEYRLRGGRQLLVPTYRKDERSNKAVLQRLYELGYVDWV